MFKLKLDSYTNTICPDSLITSISFEALTMEDKPMNAFVSITIDLKYRHQNNWVSFMPWDVRDALGLTCEAQHQLHFEEEDTLWEDMIHLPWEKEEKISTAKKYAHDLLMKTLQEQRTLS